jgi:hypothetical protein
VCAITRGQGAFGAKSAKKSNDPDMPLGAPVQLAALGSG